MRKSLFILALLLGACGGDGSSPTGSGALPLAQHVPQIANLALLPKTAAQMEGGGEMVISIQVTFSDAGKDVQTLWVDVQDGQKVQFGEFSDAATGTLTEQLAVSTKTAGTFAIEVWVVDKAGDASNHLSAQFEVTDGSQGNGWALQWNWTRQLGPLPYVLNDVVWNGTRFVAVGDEGKVLTSSDGTDWVERHSGVDADLEAVAYYESDIVAAGSDGTVLLSADSGATWTIKHRGDNTQIRAVAVSPSQIVAGGMDLRTGNVFIIRSLDRGTTWTGVDSWPRIDHFVTALAYGEGIFIAGTYAYDNDWTSDGIVMVSADGATWHDVIVQADVDAIEGVWHLGEGLGFIASGGESSVFTSMDGYNWNGIQTGVDRVDYMSAAVGGYRVVLAGGITWWYWWFGTPDFERPAGLAMHFGLVTPWEPFNIDGYYQSRGMAWGNERFVSVGQSTPASGEGAIYAAD